MARFFLSATALAAIFVAVSAAPMRRMQATTGGAAAVLSAAKPGDMLPAAQPDAELSAMRDVWANGLDVMKTFSDLFASPGFKVLSDNVEIQKKIVSQYPLLKAFDGFKDITEAADASTVQASFANGIKAIMDAMPKALETMKDPTVSTKALNKLLDSGNGMKELFEAAQGGDRSAMEQIEKALNGELYPMFNTDVFKELAASNPLGKLVENKEIMRILDQDPIVSQALRDPSNLDSFVREFARKRRL
jgi:hypothetical protein